MEQSIKVPRKWWYPDKPQTVGEHIRKVRMDKGLIQEDVSMLIGVSPDCIRCWENGYSEPQIQFMPAIIQFLGYLPIEVDTSTFGGKILLYRYQHGLSHKKLGKRLGVDASTISCWERNLQRPTAKGLMKIEHLLTN